VEPTRKGLLSPSPGRARGRLSCARDGFGGVDGSSATGPPGLRGGSDRSRLREPESTPRPAARMASVAATATRKAALLRRPSPAESRRGSRRSGLSGGVARTRCVTARSLSANLAQSSQRLRWAARNSRSSCESSPSSSSEDQARARSQPASGERWLLMYVFDAAAGERLGVRRLLKLVGALERIPAGCIVVLREGAERGRLRAAVLGHRVPAGNKAGLRTTRMERAARGRVDR
jgi:hypothetical protein